MATIATGYTAKILCSCVFVANRSAESGLTGELKNLSYVATEINESEQFATASIAGIAKRKAVYREGLGCTLLNNKTVAQIEESHFSKPTFPFNPDTIAWPMGEIDTLNFENEIDLKRLRAITDNLFIENDPEFLQNTRAVVVVYKGDIILEQYAKDFSKDTPLGGWSMTKSVTNALIGLLVKEGKLKIEAPAPIAEWQKPDDSRGAITLNHLLQMSSGLAFEERYDKYTDATKMLFASYSASDYATQSPLEKKPNTYWYYSSGTSNIISKIIRQQFDANSTYWAFPYTQLFHKIGMKSAFIEADGSGTFVGSSFMFATARDWARFGLLYAQNGKWGKEQILPKSWIDYTKKPAPAAPQGNYGAHFWLNVGEKNNSEDRPFPEAPSDMYYASGFEGQNIAIIPSEDLVVVRLGATFDRDAWNLGKYVSEVIGTLP